MTEIIPKSSFKVATRVNFNVTIRNASLQDGYAMAIMTVVTKVMSQAVVSKVNIENVPELV